MTILHYSIDTFLNKLNFQKEYIPHIYVKRLSKIKFKKKSHF